MDLSPEELLLAALLRRAIKDAQAGKVHVWDHAPSIAARAQIAPMDRFMNNDSGMGNIIQNLKSNGLSLPQ